ncbi:hypothetical protein BDV29DRAFT_200885 [Aspergillus leporis]|uniref:Cytochrome P450 n=1 Tax=Aspergillus leporis TaxID=41062 RepID=A0A5N5X3S5_9EURO|nr:hypothetical protein BDV29DRAFT_200885 [Aspergillus leporis]
MILYILARPFKTLYEDSDSCRLIIAGKAVPWKQNNLLNKHSSRALENASLRKAFGILNAFTSVDKEYAQAFKHEATILIRRTEWQTLRDVLRDHTRTWLKATESTQKARIHVPSVIQILALKGNFMVFFKNEIDPTACRDEDLSQLANAINRTWVASKSENCPKFEENDDLQNCLSTLFPNIDCLDAERNPLNLILPAFETLWRVVLRTVIEVGARGQDEWQDILIRFAEAPTASQFVCREKESSVSTKFIVNEVLRLYPPTRRVHRKYQFPGSEEHVSLAADIEACQLLTRIWGANATLFDPKRWANITPEQENAWLPFGSEPFVCPAKPVFGPRIIALLAGVILREIRGIWELESDDPELRALLSSNSRMSNERGSLDSVYLVRSREAWWADEV